MKYIGFFVAVLEPLKPTVRKLTLLSNSVHVLSDITQQSHISITVILALVSHETFANVLPEKRWVSNAAKSHTRLRNLCNFTKITPGLHRDYTRFAQGLHIFAIQELA